MKTKLFLLFLSIIISQVSCVTKPTVHVYDKKLDSVHVSGVDLQGVNNDYILLSVGQIGSAPNYSILVTEEKEGLLVSTIVGRRIAFTNHVNNYKFSQMSFLDLSNKIRNIFIDGYENYKQTKQVDFSENMYFNLNQKNIDNSCIITIIGSHYDFSRFVSSNSELKGFLYDITYFQPKSFRLYAD